MRKLSADYLFTLDAEPIKEGVVILDEQGIVLEVLKDRTSITDIEFFDGILCPGLINSHGHLELSHLKGKIERHTGLVDFILGVQKFRNADPEEIQHAFHEAENHLFDQGIVGMGDISNTDSTFGLKAKGRIRYHTFFECFGFNSSNSSKILSAAQLLKEQLLKEQLLKQETSNGLPDATLTSFSTQSNKGNKNQPEVSASPRQLNQGSINPHSPYSVSEALFRAISLSEPGIISIHNQECEAENEFYQQGTGDFQRLYKTFGIDISAFKPPGKNSLPAYAEWLGHQRKLLVHNTFTSAADLAAISKGDNYAFCLCPAANLFIENRLPDVLLLIESGWPVLIGTDSLASNDRLDLLHEMYLIQHAFPKISLKTLLTWGCKNAAEFFGWPDFGTISPGKKPGIVQIINLGADFMLKPESKSKRLV